VQQNANMRMTVLGNLQAGTKLKHVVPVGDPVAVLQAWYEVTRVPEGQTTSAVAPPFALRQLGFCRPSDERGANEIARVIGGRDIMARVATCTSSACRCRPHRVM